MRIGEYVEFMEKAFRAKRTVLAVGPPGVGKTVAKEEAARRAGMEYIGICTPLCDLSFIAGYPYREGDKASFAPFGQLAKALNAKVPTVLDYDEIGAGAESVIKGLLRQFQFGEVGDRKLPECVVLSASSNDVTHGVGVFGFNEAMKDRFHTIINVEPHIDDTVSYGLNAGWPTDLLAFLRNAPDALHDWKPSKNMSCSGATPRGWGDVAEWINLGFEDPEVIAGKVGKGRATQYLAFRKLMSHLPDIDQVLLDPKGAPVPENHSAKFLVAMALAGRMNYGTFESCITYLNRLPAMFRAFSVRDALKAQADAQKSKTLPPGTKAIHESRGFTAWACSQDGKDIVSAVG